MRQNGPRALRHSRCALRDRNGVALRARKDAARAGFRLNTTENALPTGTAGVTVRLTSSIFADAQVTRGASDRDRGWSVEMRIPWERLHSVPQAPPRPGDRWRFNAYRLEHHRRSQVEGLAFSPLFKGDFHHLPRFGWLKFGT